MTRGVENHNPGNIRYNPRNAWLGEANPPWDDKGYCVFGDDYHGLRALALDLHSKWARGLRTVAAIVSVYAPEADHNDVAAYVADVCTYMGVKEDTPLDLTLVGSLIVGMRAMIHHEQGSVPYDPSLINKAASDALAYAQGAH